MHDLHLIKFMGFFSCDLYLTTCISFMTEQRLYSIHSQENSKRIDNKIVYTNFSKLYRLRLEDSFLPGALQNPRIVTFRGPL